MKKYLGSDLSKVSNLLVALVLVVVPFHAFVTVWASTLFGHFLLLRLWDEFILFILVILVFIRLLKDKGSFSKLFSSTLVRLIAAYAALTVALGIVSLARHQVSPKALAYGLTINLRFLIWFLCVWLIAQRSDWLKTNWKKLTLWPLTAVLVFGLMQFFILPHNFLSHFGYSKNTYVPFITINQNTSTIRVQSFLRGANPLGEYLAAMASLLAGLISFSRKNRYFWLLLIGTLLVLFLSFSRSGWIGAVIGIVACIGLSLRTQKQRLIGLTFLVVVGVVLAGSYLVLRHNASVQDAVLHVSSHSTAQQTSNEGHLASLKQSLKVIVHQPIGAGPGTSGQASWYNTGHSVRNTESYFLQIGEEVGLLGLALFLAILFMTGRELWARRNNPLALGLLAGLFGLLFIAQLSYAWSDDTLAYVWWGLAGIALS